MPENQEEIMDAEIVEDEPEQKQKALATVTNAGGSMSRISAHDLELALVEEQAKRNLIEQFIHSNLTQGVDYDTIPGCGAKKTLLKPGAERVCSLLRLQPVFKMDAETYNMMPERLKQQGIVCYKCELVNTAGEVVGEGRGSETLDPNSKKTGWDANKAIKIAQKRAQVDAVLRVAALSDRFTQDVEDMPTSEANNSKPQYNKPQGTPAKTSGAKSWEKDKCDAAVRKKVESVCVENGIDLISLLQNEFDGKKLEELTKGEAYYKIMAEIKKGNFTEYSINDGDPELDLDKNPF